MDGSYFGTKIILSNRASLPHKYSDFGAMSVKEGRCAALISKVECHTYQIGFVPHFGAV